MKSLKASTGGTKEKSYWISFTIVWHCCLINKSSIFNYRDDRIANLEKDKLAYYCDICRPKKLLKGASDEGAIKSTICHLAIQHHELRYVYFVKIVKSNKNQTLEKWWQKDRDKWSVWLIDIFELSHWRIQPFYNLITSFTILVQKFISLLIFF